jgi:hypothetical protein
MNKSPLGRRYSKVKTIQVEAAAIAGASAKGWHRALLPAAGMPFFSLDGKEAKDQAEAKGNYRLCCITLLRNPAKACTAD